MGTIVGSLTKFRWHKLNKCRKYQLDRWTNERCRTDGGRSKPMISESSMLSLVYVKSCAQPLRLKIFRRSHTDM